MAAGEEPLVEQSTVPVVSDVADAASKPHVRPAFFLRPRARDGAAPPAPPGDPGPVPTLPAGIEAEFKGWTCVPRRWPEWVDKLRRRHEPQWRELGILGGILASKSRVRRRDHDRALLQLAAFWSRATSTFVFPWGEATLTLEDMHALAGLPLVGVSVREPVSDSLEKDVAAIEVVRAVLNRSKEKKASYGGWVKRFVERAPEAEEAPPSAAGGDADREARELVEHGAFLSMWLSLFVLPGPPYDVVRREVLPLAARLARGQRVALAPAALASIYHDLSELKRLITTGKKKEPLVVSAPAHILQLWVWEHFTQLSPEPSASSARGDHDMPRAARWHKVGKTLSSKDVHAVFMSPKQFKWRPYGNLSLFGLQPEMGRFWSTATSEELLSLRRCLHACELVGMNCIQQYNPHRVARQLGFDQDIPGTVPRASSGWEKAWETFNIDAEGPAFIFENYMPGVTVQYAKWWKPYSSACGSSIGNNAKMKERHDFDRPAKRKMEGVLAGNSGKNIRLSDATTRGRQPNIPPGTNVYPSQSSGNHASMRQAMPTTGMPQPLTDEADDPQDHISLSERLNSIINMPKQRNTECLVISDDDECDKSSSKGHEVSAMHLKSHMPGAKMSIIGERNEDTKLVDATNNEQDSQVLKKVTKQGNFNDIVEISDDELDGKTRPVAKMAIIGERNEDTNLVDARNDEQDSQILKKVTKQGNFNDIVEISDDELDEQTNKKAGMFVEATSKEDVLDTMRLKSPEMEPTLTILQECNEEKQMVDDQDNSVMKEGTVQNNYDHQLASVQDDTTPRRQPDILTHPATVETNDGLLQGPAEEMDDGSLNFSEKGNEDILAADQESEHPMEHSAGTSINKSGNSERLSSRLLDGNTKLDQEVCTKTLYYLSRFDRMKDAWEKDANTLPKRAVGTIDMILKASAIRQAEMAELKKKINTLKEEIRALETA